jgi:hypothetical protein
MDRMIEPSNGRVVERVFDDGPYTLSARGWFRSSDAVERHAVAVSWLECCVAGLPEQVWGAALVGEVVPPWRRGARAPWGEPGTYYARLGTYSSQGRTGEALLRPAKWARALREISGGLREVDVMLSRLGFAGGPRFSADEYVTSPGRLFLNATLVLPAVPPRAGFPEVDPSWLVGIVEAMGRRGLADLLMVTTAQRGAGLDADGVSMPYLDRVVPGYEWVMVIPAPVAVVVGGAQGLRSSGVFARVEGLPGGRVFYQATASVEEYTLERARAVAEVLAPVLPAVTPHPVDVERNRCLLPDALGRADVPAELAR